MGLLPGCSSSARDGDPGQLVLTVAMLMSSDAPLASESEEGWRSVGIFKKRHVLSKLKAISLPSSRNAHQRNHPDSMPAFRSSAQRDIPEKNCTARILPLIQNRTAGSYRPEACDRLSAAIS